MSQRRFISPHTCCLLPAPLITVMLRVSVEEAVGGDGSMVDEEARSMGLTSGGLRSYTWDLCGEKLTIVRIDSNDSMVT